MEKVRVAILFFSFFIFLYLGYLLYFSRDFCPKKRFFFVCSALVAPISIFLVKRLALWMNGSK